MRKWEINCASSYTVSLSAQRKSIS